MSSPFATYPVPERTFIPSNPASRAAGTPVRGTGAKRGRKPKNASLTTDSTRTSPQTSPTSSQPTPLRWAAVQSNTPGPSTVAFPDGVASPATSIDQTQHAQLSAEAGGVLNLSGVAGTSAPLNGDPPSHRASLAPGAAGADEEGEGEDELLPAMADDDYSAQLSWQSQSKDNLKYVNAQSYDNNRKLTPEIFRVLMDSFSPSQYDRFEAYRRHALPKQAVRKVCIAYPTTCRHQRNASYFQVIQQTLGQQVSQPVAQIVAGFSKVFVGEIIEKGV